MAVIKKKTYLEVIFVLCSDTIYTTNLYEMSIIVIKNLETVINNQSIIITSYHVFVMTY